MDSRDRNISFYFWAVNDGHGGDGCSLFLKNLHKKEISIKVLKNTINEAKKDFLKNIPVVNGKLYDLSGSWVVMALIKNGKCIIANTGDSCYFKFNYQKKKNR